MGKSGVSTSESCLVLTLIDSAAVLTLALLIALPCAAGERLHHFTGNPQVDFFSSGVALPQGQSSSFESALQEQEDKKLRLEISLKTKSPWLAGAMSLAVPGTGEFYTESYWKSGLFFTLEVTGWILAYSYEKKGDRQTKLFEGVANDHWSVVRYARWLVAHRGASISIDPDESLPPWRRVDWAQLNAAERQAGRGFSHTLPPHGDQQYYELIGKYNQYSPGWDDYAAEENFEEISRRFLEYSRMRGKANDFYNVSSTVLSLIVVNHVLSAVDAYFTAIGYNNSIRAEVRMNIRETPFGAITEPVGIVKVMF